MIKLIFINGSNTVDLPHSVHAQADLVGSWAMMTKYNVELKVVQMKGKCLQ